MEQEIKDAIREVETMITRYLPKEATYQKIVQDAMEYTFMAGGKRIRPLLMLSVYRMLGGSESVIEPFMAAIEMIHTYSLIHDDLPALDNDDYRRGRKTAHVVYGEAMAILAGDALLNYAYETAAGAFGQIPEAETEDAAGICRELELRKRVEKAMEILAAKPGIYGMIGGQTVDVALNGQEPSAEEMLYIYENKTGALIEASMTIGAVLAGAAPAVVEMIEKVAYNIGMAFQIQDDILDETATFEELGKPIHSDEKNHKVTYVTIHGLEDSKLMVEQLSREAASYLEQIDGDETFLKQLIEFLIDRKN